MTTTNYWTVRNVTTNCYVTDRDGRPRRFKSLERAQTYAEGIEKRTGHVVRVSSIRA